MSNQKETDEKKDPKVIYESFIGAMANLEGAENAGKAIRSEKIGDRMKSRDFAISSTSIIPGLEAIASDPVAKADILKSDASVDVLIKHAVDYSSKQAKDLFSKETDSILASTPDKGLEGVVLSIPSVDMKGNKEYEKAAEAHSGYQKIVSHINFYKETNRIDHPKIHKDLINYVSKETKDKNTINAAGFILASSKEACLNAANNFAIRYANKFGECLSGDKEVAEYARATLKKAKPEVAMKFVLDAYKIANSKAA